MKQILRLLALCSIFLLMACAEKKPKDIAEEAAQCMQKKDFDRLVDLLAQNGETPENEKKLLVSLLDEKQGNVIDYKNGIQSFQVGEEIINKEKGIASVKVVFFYGDGTSKEELLRFTKKEGEWFLVM